MSALQTWGLLAGLVLAVVGVLTLLVPRRGMRLDDRPTSAASATGRQLRLVPTTGTAPAHAGPGRTAGRGDEPGRGAPGSSPLHLTRRDVAVAILLPDEERLDHVQMRGSMARHPSGRRFRECDR